MDVALDIADALRAAIGTRLRPSKARRSSRSISATGRSRSRRTSTPAVAVYPRSTEEVAAVLRTCNAHAHPGRRRRAA